MTNNRFVILLEDSQAELADASSGKFKQFWKQIVKFGDYVDPNNPKGKMRLNKPWAEKALQNFQDKVAGRVPVPVGHPRSPEDLVMRNQGELMDMQLRDDGVWGLLEIRDAKTAQDIEDDKLWDVSISFDDHYVDKKTGKDVGPTILHVGLVDNPYLKGMAPFQALSQAFGGAVMLSESSSNNNEEEPTMTKVKNEREFEVEVKYTENGEEKVVKVAPGAEVEVPEDAAETVTKQVTDAEAPKKEDDKAEDGGAQEAEAAKKEKEVADRETAAAKKEEELAEKEAGMNYEKLLSEGKIVPAQRDAFMALSKRASTTVELAEGKTETVGNLLAELFTKGRKVVALDDEKGGSGDGEDGNKGGEPEVTDEEKSLATSFGNTPEELAEYKKTHPENN